MEQSGEYSKSIIVLLGAEILQVYSSTGKVRVSGVELLVLFTTVFLHELAHSSLVWYGGGSCNSPILGLIDGEAGDFYERAIFGGVSSCEITKNDLEITKVGFYINRVFYAIGEFQQ